MFVVCDVEMEREGRERSNQTQSEMQSRDVKSLQKLNGKKECFFGIKTIFKASKKSKRTAYATRSKGPGNDTLKHFSSVSYTKEYDGGVHPFE